MGPIKSKAVQAIKPSILTEAAVQPLFLFNVSPAWIGGTATEMRDKREADLGITFDGHRARNQ
jgi:hypothetical protein